MDIESLRNQYTDNAGRAGRLRDAIVEQLEKMFERKPVALGVPMESRVKSWSSIEEKLQRKSLIVDNITDLNDLVGVRAILLFRVDLSNVHELISDTFDVLSNEDTAERLGDEQFGYQSKHYVVRLPKSWLAIPTMEDLGDLQAELQIRTLAQHIWAAASHKLQYKHEASVPPPLRRTIFRISALLETVDLEFDRVLAERETYRDSGIAAITGSEPLNVEILSSVLAEAYPAENRSGSENYEELLIDLKNLSVNTVDELRALINKHMEQTRKDEKKAVESNKKGAKEGGAIFKRVNRGVFFEHVGLARSALRAEFGEKANKVFSERSSSAQKKTKRKVRKQP